MEYWLLETGPEEQPGVNGGLLRRQGTEGLGMAVEISSVDEFVEWIQQNGGQIVAEKREIPGVGYFASLQDTEGNTVGIIGGP